MHPLALAVFALPLRNPVGFADLDFVELGLAAAALLLAAPARNRIGPAARRLAERTGWTMAALAALAIVLRLALLPLHPVPTPAGADDFSYLLLGDTLAHFRLANPPHPMHRFFETTFVLQEPSYSSIYPVGPALVLALGQIVFGLPWAGVALSAAAFCALCYWMLRGWTTPGWSLAGGLLAVCEFGPLSNWMNSYWGGAVSAAAGCLVFGALPRIRERGRVRDAVVLGLGIGLQMLSRPYESLFLDVAVVLFWIPELRRRKKWPKLARAAVPAALAVLPALLLIGIHNRAVTGSWTTLPYELSRYQYGIPTTFTIQPVPLPHASLTAAQRLYYEGQSAAHGGSETPVAWLERFWSRLPFYRFFLLPPLMLAAAFFLPLMREFRYLWVGVTIALFALGTTFYPYFFPHYIAAAACLFVLAGVRGLQRMKPGAARGILLLCGAHFLFWYGVHALGSERLVRVLAPYETADAINFGDPAGRIAVDRLLEAAPGRHLVLVRYSSSHGYSEWIHNAADIDGARVVMALELNPDDNDALERYYPGRTVWLLEPDLVPPRLRPYPARSGPFLNVE
jgi:hypothetical protein